MGDQIASTGLPKQTLVETVEPPDRSSKQGLTLPKPEITQFDGVTLSPAKSEGKKATQNYLQESFEKELSRVKKTTDYNDTSSLFSNNTDNDSTRKFISILDKINENQIKKNRFYTEIIKDIDFEQQHLQGHLHASEAKKHDDYSDVPSFDESMRAVPINEHFSTNQYTNRSENTGAVDPNAAYVLSVRGPNSAQTRGNNSGHQIEHILEVHQPNQHEIIFECSKEWTVNQTPDMREKEVMPAHLALHFERMRNEVPDTTEASPQIKTSLGTSQDIKDRRSQPSKIYRLNCQKELFTTNKDKDDHMFDIGSFDNSQHAGRKSAS